jgi:glutathione synthase/RimK-type ligase-like ATP-grasp enzyme
VIHSGQIDIAFVTASELPIPERETHLIAAAAENHGLRAEIIEWGSNVDWTKLSLVVIRTTWDYFKHLLEFLAWARKVDKLTRLVTPYSIIEWNSSKRYLLELSRKGVPVVPTILLKRGAVNTIEGALENSGLAELVIKPAVSASAFGIMRAKTEGPESIHHLEKLLAEGDILIQPFVPDVLVAGEVSMMYFDGEFSHASRKRPAPGEYRVQDEYGGTVHPHAPSAEEFDVADAALSATPGPTTYARIDLVKLENRSVVMELELIEPELFLSSSPESVQVFARKLCSVAGNPA